MFERFLYTLSSIWAIGLVRFVVFLALAFVAAKVVSNLVTKLLKKLKLDEKLDKWGIHEGAVGTSMKFVGKLVYLLVFLCFLPSALEAIGISSIASPISRFVAVFVEYLPNILAALVLVYVGVLIARLLGQVVCVLLKKTKLDDLMKKAAGENSKAVSLSEILTKILVGFVTLVAIVAALSVLDIPVISEPAISIIYSIFGAIPNVVLAVVVAAVGMLVANLACGLLQNVLTAVNFDALAGKFLPGLKASAAKVLVNVVKAFLLVFIAAQSLQALELPVFAGIAAELIGYLPILVKAALIVLGAAVGANLVEGAAAKCCAKAAKAAKAVVYVVAGFMVLSQLGIASAIVEKVFVLIVAALAVAFAIAFGLGGKEFAFKTLKKLEEKNKEE